MVMNCVYNATEELEKIRYLYAFVSPAEAAGGGDGACGSDY
jgi:hypothetical protein